MIQRTYEGPLELRPWNGTCTQNTTAYASLEMSLTINIPNGTVTLRTVLYQTVHNMEIQGPRDASALARMV